MRRDVAVHTILLAARRAGAAVFVGNGVLCRVAYAADAGDVFYMLGSMSLAPALAIGYGGVSGRACVALEGDGNALMGLSCLPLATTVRQPYVHAVLDNGRYESTGGQPTLAARVDLCAMAAAAGYHTVATTADAGALRELLEESLATARATYLRLPVPPEHTPPPPRVPLHPRQIAARFRDAALTRVRAPEVAR